MKELLEAYRDEEAIRVVELIAGFIKGNLNPAEEQELDNWVNVDDDNLFVFEELTDPGHSVEFWSLVDQMNQQRQ